MLKLNSSSIVGSASKKSWSQAQGVHWLEGETYYIVINLNLDGENELVDLASIGSAILGEFEKNPIKKVSELVGGVSSEVGVAVLIAKVKGEEIWIERVGAMGAYLVRDKMMARLLANGQSETKGAIKLGDTLLLASDAMIEGITANKIKEILVSDQAPAELIAPLVHAQDDGSAMSGLIVKVEVQPKLSQVAPITIRLLEPRRKNLWLGIIALVILLLMIGVGVVRKEKLSQQKMLSDLTTLVQTKIEESGKSAELNPDRARELLAEALAEVEAYLKQDLGDQYKESGAGLLVKIKEAEERSFKKSEISTKTVVEFDVLMQGLKVDGMETDGKGELLLLDRAGKQVVGMNLQDRSRRVIDYSGGAEELVDIANNDTKIVGLFDKGVLEMSWKNKDSKTVVTADEFWKEPRLIEVFAGNLYILDRTQNEIWKYPTLGDTFGGRRRWLAAGITPDLSNVVEMRVNGDVWLLTSTGKLVKYSRGAPQKFELTGYPYVTQEKKLAEPRSIWAGEESIYILESGASRVVEVGLDGSFKGQMVNAEFAKASNLVVVDGKGYVIVDNKIKEFEL